MGELTNCWCRRKSLKFTQKVKRCGDIEQPPAVYGSVKVLRNWVELPEFTHPSPADHH